MDQKLEQIILKTPEYFLPDKSAGVSLIAQLNLRDDNTLDYWTLKIENQQCEVKHEKADLPQFELSISVSDLKDIITGKLNATHAYMRGKLDLRGNIRLALKSMELFNIPDDIWEKIQL